jgi:phage repressor protein C with HTH and peptisase S24 domain
MLSHDRVWAAIDALAERYSLSASGLAKLAGLDSTAFNKSKRLSADGRPRWPSTESLAKIIEATGASLDEFVALVEERASAARQGLAAARMPGRGRATVPPGFFDRPPFDHPLPRQRPTVPLVGFAQAGAGGFYEDAGFPAGHGLDLIELPAQSSETSYALKVQGDSMLPLYRDGDVLIVQPGATVRKGDRVVVKTAGGEVMAKVLERQSPKAIALVSLNPAHPNRELARTEIEWVARIVWASQ